MLRPHLGLVHVMWRSLFWQLGLSWLHFGNCNQLVLLPLRRAGNGVNVELSGRLTALQLFALRPVAVSAPVYPAAAQAPRETPFRVIGPIRNSSFSA